MNNWLTVEFWETVARESVMWSIKTLPSILLILLLAFFGFSALKLLLKKFRKILFVRIDKNKSIDSTEAEKRIDTLLGIVTMTTRTVVWVMIVLLLLRKLGIDIAPLIAGAGIVGLAVGFGAQELVRDVISGFFILLENQVRTGDVAIINGTGGLVENIGLRTITLRDLSGVVHIFQNGKIDTLSNMTKEWSGMVFDIGVAYKEDTDRVVEIIKNVAEELRTDPEFQNKINEPIEVFGVDAFADSAVVIKARFKTKPIMQWAVGREYRRRLKKAFDEQNIEIPFPHRTVYWGEAIKPLMVNSNQEKG
jgi:small conductance mechanosensitive channel